MYASSLSQPDSLKQNDEDDIYGGSFSLSQPNLTYRSPLTSPNHSPVLSPFQSMILPTTTNTVVMTKTFGNDRSLSPVRENGNSFLSSKVYSMNDSKLSNYYVSPSETPKVLSPVLGNRKLEDPFSPSVNYYPMSVDNPGKKKNSGEKRVRKKSVVHALENIIEPNHQSDPLQGETKKSKYERKFDVFQLQNGKKCKVIYEGQFSRWIEEDPFSIYSDDVTRFSTTPSSTFEQRNDLSFERIVSQNNNGYWQKNNFLITRNEVILFPNGKWDNRVVEVMSITDDINISISSILIAKLEWIIEVKTSESNVYTQSNFIYQAYKAVEKELLSNDTKKEPTSDKINKIKDTKSGEKDNKGSNKSSTTPSRQVKWILKFNDRESMLYFISLIKYIQTKKIKKLVNDEEEWGSLESDISSSFTSEDNEEGKNVDGETSAVLPLDVKETKTLSSGYGNITSPTSNFLNIPLPIHTNEIGQSPPPRRERTSSLSDRFYTSTIERRGSAKNTNIFSPVIETEDEYANISTQNSYQRYYSNMPLPPLEEVPISENLTKEENKNSIETSSNDVNALLKDSIRKAELEIMKLQNWRKNKSQSVAINNMDTKAAIVNDNGIEELEKVVSPSFSSPKTNWQNSIDRNRRSRVVSWNPNSSAAIFTNIQLSYLDMLENKAKNKVIKLNSNRNSTASEKDNLIQVKVTDTEETNPKPATEESNVKTEKPKKKNYAIPPRLQRSSSLKKDKDLTTSQRNSLSPNSKSHPIAIPHSSPSSKYNSVSTIEIGTSEGSSGNILRKGSVTGMSNNSSTFYSPRSSSLFMDDINVLQKGSVGSQKRISGILNSEKKTNSIITNLTSTSASSEAVLTDQQNAFSYGVSLNDNDDQLQRNSVQSNVSRNSLDSSDHAGHSTTKSTPDISQVTAMLRKNSLEGVDMSMPPLNEDESQIPYVGVKNANVVNPNNIIHPIRSSSYHNLGLVNNNAEFFTSAAPSANTTTTNSSTIESRPRSGSKTIISSLYRSNSYSKKNFGTAGANTLDTSEATLKKLANANVKPTSIAPLDNTESDSSAKRISSGSEMSKNEAAAGQGNVEGNYLPYMMDLKSSNELYLASLQQHFQQQPIQPTVIPNSPILNYKTAHSQSQSPLISQIQPHILNNNVINENVYKPTGLYGARNPRITFDPNTTNYYSSKPVLLKYFDAEGQLVTFELNDESIIPTSFLRNYPKKKSTTMDPIIMNYLKILKLLEQTYL